MIRDLLQDHDAANHEERENLYDIYMDSGGGHQAFGNPVGYDWRNRITSRFGYRKNPTGPGSDNHTGLDIGLPTGTPLYSVQDGAVTLSGWHDLYGWTIVVEDNEGKQSRLAHCSSLLASVGETVRKGDNIAVSGNSGNSSGPHLHIEVRINGQLLNPEFLLDYTMP